MKRPSNIVVLAVAVMVILLAGEFFVYGVNPDRANSEIRAGAEGYVLDLYSNYSTDFTVLVTDSQCNGEPRELYIYCDHDYGTFIEDSYLDYWIDKMGSEFRVYGFSDHTVINAEGLRDMMAGSIANGSASRTAILVLTGVLPDTVYGDEPSLFEAWLEDGGAVYWSGAPMGMFVGHPESENPSIEVVTEDPGLRFFGISGSIRTQEAPDQAIEPSSDRYLGEALGIYYDNCNYGVSSDVPDSLFIGCEKDGYNSVSLSRYSEGSGQICIFGGAFPPNNMQNVHANMLRLFFSGLYYDSVVIFLEDSFKDAGTKSVNLDVGGGETVFVMYGSLMGTYGRTYHIDGEIE